MTLKCTIHDKQPEDYDVTLLNVTAFFVDMPKRILHYYVANNMDMCELHNVFIIEYAYKPIKPWNFS